jgi:hypothetical protein
MSDQCSLLSIYFTFSIIDTYSTPHHTSSDSSFGPMKHQYCILKHRRDQNLYDSVVYNRGLMDLVFGATLGTDASERPSSRARSFLFPFSSRVLPQAIALCSTTSDLQATTLDENDLYMRPNRVHSRLLSSSFLPLTPLVSCPRTTLTDIKPLPRDSGTPRSPLRYYTS